MSIGMRIRAAAEFQVWQVYQRDTASVKSPPRNVLRKPPVSAAGYLLGRDQAA